jgi:unsaturated rhamnogalacturonyl hydrolase
MKKVADWELAQPTKAGKETAWTYGALYAGMMALSQVADTPKYHDAMVSMGQRQGWKPGPRVYHADDHCVCQTYLELYLQDRQPEMLTPTKSQFDSILANSLTNAVGGKGPDGSKRWSWCDSLFMAPTAWLELSLATGDKKYLEFMNREWWSASDLLYDQAEHLYYRDSSFFKKHEANGKKVFWSRGNGWVMAGLARMLQRMPHDYPDRQRYEKQFKEMAARVAELQPEGGLWHPSLLDPQSYPMKEVSGSGFYTFALAWGINRGILDRATYEPVVRRAWQGLVDCVTPEGKLEHVQPVGATPKSFDPHNSEVFGSGAFLLAGSEMYRLALND